jgi:hypothetical protein
MLMCAIRLQCPSQTCCCLLTFLYPEKCHTGTAACNVRAAAAQIIALVLQLLFQSPLHGDNE